MGRAEGFIVSARCCHCATGDMAVRGDNPRLSGESRYPEKFSTTAGYGPTNLARLRVSEIMVSITAILEMPQFWIPAFAGKTRTRSSILDVRPPPDA